MGYSYIPVCLAAGAYNFGALTSLVFPLVLWHIPVTLSLFLPYSLHLSHSIPGGGVLQTSRHSHASGHVRASQVE